MKPRDVKDVKEDKAAAPHTFAEHVADKLDLEEGEFPPEETTRPKVAVPEAEAKEDNEDEIAQDVGSVVFFEHINLNVPDAHVADIFYSDCLGLTRDPYRTGTVSGATWINVGRQQIHLPSDVDNPAQYIRGVIGLSVRPDVYAKFKANFDEAVKAAAPSRHLEGTNVGIDQKSWSKFGYKQTFKRYQGSAPEYLEVTCPWGNCYRIHPAQPLLTASLGISYVALKCLHGTAKHIAQFYHNMLGATVHLTTDHDAKVEVARISLGPQQDLIFTEIPKSEPQQLEAYDGHHICIYINNFSETFKKFKSRKLVFVNKRFSDKAGSLEEALKYRCFRFKDIVMTEGRGRLFQLEHEVRSMFHPSYLRPLVNRVDHPLLPF